MLDCGVVVLNDHPTVDYYTFIEDQLHLVVSSEHPLSLKSQVQLKDVKEESFIMFNQDFESRNIIIQACKRQGFEPKIVSETSQIDFWRKWSQPIWE